MRRYLLLMCAMGIAGVLLWSEFVHWRASRRLLGVGGPYAGTEVVIVLGAKNRGLRANYLNRYRVRAALRSQDPTVQSLLVICGGPVGGNTSEADIMARYARETCGYRGPIRLDTESMTTRENLKNAIPLIEDAGTIKIVSNSIHAERARAYLWQLRPDLARRLERGADYRFGEIALLKPVLGLKGRRRRRR